MLDQSHIQAASRILNSYVAAHDQVFKFSLKKVLPISGLFEKIDYAGINCEVSDSYSDLLQLIEARKSLDLKSEENSLFFHYLVALDMAVEKFLSILTRLHFKAEGTESYTRAEYKADNAEYEKLVKEYSALGARLNNVIQLGI